MKNWLAISVSVLVIVVALLSGCSEDEEVQAGDDVGISDTGEDFDTGEAADSGAESEELDSGESEEPDTEGADAEEFADAGTEYGEEVTLDQLEVVFAQSFDETPTGDYLRSHWSDDWGISQGAWSDPCHGNCDDEEAWAGARLTIEVEGESRFMRHVNDTKGLSPGTTGIQWWKGLGDHEELYLSYRVRFSGNDWEGPSYHGKLPGLCGNEGCPGGGNPPDHEDGFSTRLMFHGTDTLFFYLYYAGMDTSSSNYGNSLSFSAYDNEPDQWRTVTQRVVLNTPGEANGILEGFLDGELVAQKTDMDFRNTDDQFISTLVFTNFLGGSGEEPSDYGDEPVNDFDEVIVYRYGDHISEISRGLEPHQAGTSIPIPRF